ncbi:hypothetical protein F7P75_02210 [Acinetobacter gandensis]|uniref:SPOR domain-containing protein n=1 Tax=Acinetobacter gandensis TaxID=1443941 RepID=A0A1A7RCH2_9GAMM|nr:hypothetical protein [Acinetobacter gandensis]KAB0629191.1 hypothetical protein F7P75_02210 [Acinetobacter gandensis]OBX29143.1 hypothetical protein A9J31_02310 [Acinetobacter gandensis]
MAARQLQWQKIHHYIWLVAGTVCLFAALVFWAITDTKELVEVGKVAETEVELQIQPEKVAAMSHLGALNEEVRPLDMTTRVVATAQHEPEFRGTKFISDTSKQYAIELFRVSNEDILKSFLRKQVERHKFVYLRLSGEDHPEQYVILLGPYSSQNDAKSNLAELNIALPASVKPAVVELKQYQPYVNDLGSDETSSNQKLYAVKLKPAALPKIDEAQLAARKALAAVSNAISPQANATTSTTVTRRDASGNVVDVQKSQSSVETPRAKPAPAEQEVTDPFN